MSKPVKQFKGVVTMRDNNTVEVTVYATGKQMAEAQAITAAIEMARGYGATSYTPKLVEVQEVQ